MISKEITIKIKKCNSCLLLLEIENFHNTKNGCRYDKVSQCKVCKSIKNKNRYNSVRERVLSMKKQQYLENKTLFSDRIKSYRERNPEKFKIARRQWENDNQGKLSAAVALRRSLKRKATPNWLSKEQKEKMVLYYKLAKKLAKINSIKYHVDHIVPLKGTNVCGLHVPWNLQVIPASENLMKSNHFE